MMKTKDILPILKVLEKDIEKKINFLQEELKHIKKVSSFLSQKNNAQENYTNTSLSSAFQNIEYILMHIDKNSRFIYEQYNYLKLAIKKTIENKNDSVNGLSKDLIEVFDKYTITKYEHDQLIENFSFLQRKIINILNSFPFYYPTPKISSHKEASKIHFFLEWISNEFLEFINNYMINSINVQDTFLKNLEIKSSFYWNFASEIRFIPDIVYSNNGKKVLNFVISSDSYLPYRRSHYILLLHECLHFYFNFLDKEFKRKSYLSSDDNWEDEFPKEFRILREYIIGAYSLIKDIDPNNTLTFNDILDIFIDAILTKVFGYLYYLPLFSHIFVYDEGFFINPDLRRIWFIRTKVPSLFLKKNDKISEKEINIFLDKYKEAQIKIKKNIEDLYIRDETIIGILKQYIQKYIDNHEKLSDNIFDYLNQTSNNLTLLLNYQREYMEDIIDNFYKKEREKQKPFYEGRTLAVKIHNKLLNVERTYNIINVPREDLRIFKFKYIKARTNSNFREQIDRFIENSDQFYLFNYGSFSFLCIEEESSETTSYDENEKLENQLRSFINNYELTLYCGNIDEFREILRNMYEYIFINMKIMLKRKENGNDKVSFEKFKEDFEKNIRKIIRYFNENNIKLQIFPFYFISFDWFDLFITLSIKLGGMEKNNLIELNELLLKIKEFLLVENKYLYRSETDIFIGNKLVQNIEINKPKLQLRLSSGHSPSILKEINKIFNPKTNIGGFLLSLKKANINYLYGIRDIEIEYKNKHILKEILEDIIKLLPSTQNTDEQENVSDIQFLPSICLK